MINREKDYLFQYLIRYFDPQIQGTLNQMYARYRSLEEDNRRRELEQLKQEIVNEVLNRLSLSADVQKAVKAIKELNSEINHLSK